MALINEDAVDEIARQIVRYLDRHPNAADTFDGIHRWWLSRIRIEETARDVQAALDELVLRGHVIRQALPDGRPLYRSALTVAETTHAS